MVGTARAARGSLCGDRNGALRGNPNGEWWSIRYRIATHANAGAPPFLLSGFRTGRPRLRFHENMKTGIWRFLWKNLPPRKKMIAPGSAEAMIAGLPRNAVSPKRTSARPDVQETDTHTIGLESCPKP